MTLEIRQIIYDSVEYNSMLALRNKMLRHPLGLELTHIDINADVNASLLGCFDGKVLKGCLVLHREGDWVRMRQVSVDETAQGLGIGRKMLDASCRIVRIWGCSRMFCNARGTAKGFYIKNGWEIAGEDFIEDTVVHCRMEKHLPEEK